MQPIGRISILHQLENHVFAGHYRCYELQLPPGVEPKPNDDEVDGFTSLTISELIEAIVQARFIPTAALSWLLFLDKHGHLDDQPDLEVVRSLLQHPLV